MSPPAAVTEAPKEPPQMASVRELFHFADTRDKLFMLVGTAAAALSGLSYPVFQLMIGRMMDVINRDPTRIVQAVRHIAVVLVYIGAANFVTGFTQVYCWTRAGESVSYKMRVAHVQSILRQDISWFDANRPAEVSTRVAELAGKVLDGTGRRVADIICLAVQFLASVAVAVYLSWRLAVVLLTCVPLLGLVARLMIASITAANAQSSEQYAEAGGVAAETFSLIRTVTALNAQPAALRRYGELLQEAMRAGVRKGRDVGLTGGLFFAVTMLTYSLGFWYGSQLVIEDLQRGCSSGCVTGGVVYSVFNCVLIGSIGIGQMAAPTAAFTEARCAAHDMLTLVRLVPPIDSTAAADPGDTEAANTCEADYGTGSGTTYNGGNSNSANAVESLSAPGSDAPSMGCRLDFEHVHFSYPTRPEVPVSRDFNVTVGAGQTLALVGDSGSGKSTIASLLLRLYDPQRGVVRMDGRDIKTLDVRWLRQRFGYVGQEPVLFPGSIAWNIVQGIGWGQEEPSSVNGWAFDAMPDDIRARVLEAAANANAHEFVASLPRGYDTEVGSNGAQLSGGQKQRIAIARALIRRPAVLLLDEATSALDAASEQAVQGAIDRLQASRAQTTIVIAHRLSTVRGADKIAVVDGGRIVEQGTHDELLAMSGHYTELISLQLERRDEGTGSSREARALNKVVKGAARATRAVSFDESFTDGSVDVPVVPEPAQEMDDADDNKTCVTTDEAREYRGRLGLLLMDHPWYLLAGVLGAGAFGSLYPTWGYLLSQSLGSMYNIHDIPQMRVEANRNAVAFMLLAGFVFVASTCEYWNLAVVGERVAMRLRNDVFRAVIRREIGFFDRPENSVGALTTRLAEDSRRMQKAGGDTLAKAVEVGFILVIALGLSFSASWEITLVTLATFPLSVLAAKMQMSAYRGQHVTSKKESGLGSGPGVGPSPGSPKSPTVRGESNEPTSPQGEAQASDVGNSAIDGAGMLSLAVMQMKTVTAFSMQPRVVAVYAAAAAQERSERESRAVVGGIAGGSGLFVRFSTYALVYWYGSSLIAAGAYSFTQVLAAMQSLMYGVLGLGGCLGELSDQSAGYEACKRVFDLIDAGARGTIDGLMAEGVAGSGSNVNSSGGGPLSSVVGRIEFRNVTFVYPSRPSAVVCHRLSLTIEPGQVVALVGLSGSGKSSLMSLLLRLYDPVEGAVLLDGRDLREYNVRWLRDQLGYVGQEPALFRGSVLQNILRGRTQGLSMDEHCALSGPSAEVSRVDVANIGDIELGSGGKINTCVNAVAGTGGVEGESTDPDADVVTAAVTANVDSFVSQLPRGYDTDVGNNSSMVSGGQKQRIAIARALIRRPAVLLLDEATSALDAASEQAVQGAIDRLQASRAQTTIVIAHRLSTVRGADKIAVVDGGRIVEQGTHDELLAMSGLYCKLWSRQQQDPRLNKAAN